MHIIVLYSSMFEDRLALSFYIVYLYQSCKSNIIAYAYKHMQILAVNSMQNEKLSCCTSYYCHRGVQLLVEANLILILGIIM